MRQIIFLSGVLEGIAGFLAFAFVIGGFFFVFQWVMAKFAGVRYHGKYQAGKAYRENIIQENILNDLAIENPELFSRAIERCKKKKYALTHFNVLSESMKIEKEESGLPQNNFSQNIKNSIGALIDLIKGDNSTTKIEKLERLNELYKDGIINSEELAKMKNEIL